MKLKHLAFAFYCSLFFVSCDYSNRDLTVSDSDAKTEDIRPNIIYILADDLGYGDIGVYGQKHIMTPHLDRLAEEGLLFTQHYSGAPICAPSRSALLEGKHTGRTQIRGNGGKKAKAYLRKGTVTLGSILQSAGYRTGVIGKWGLGTYEDEGAPNSHGIDYFYGFLDQSLAHNYYPEYLWENGQKRYFNNRGIAMHPKHVDIKTRPIEESYKDFIGNDYSVYHMQNKALEFIRQNSKSAFFLYYATPLPHAALQIPDEELEPYSFEETPFAGGYYSPHPRPKAARAAMISLLDRQVGEIMSLTESLGIAENTLIVFTSDNGPAIENSTQEDIDFFNANGGMRGYKRSTTEGGIRVPTIAYWPGQIKAGTVTDHISAMWDFLPTAADLAGAVAPEDIDGISFAPTLLGHSKQKQHDYLYWEYHERRGAGPSQAIRKGRWKAIRSYTQIGDNTTFLYDLESDPNETKNLSEAYPDLTQELIDLMAERERTSNPRWNFETP